MKKIISALLLSAAAISCAWAQTEPNRVIITYADGTISSHMADRIESVKFATVAGDVKAEAKVTGFDLDRHQVSFTISGTPETRSWKYAIMPENEFNILANDAMVASQINALCERSYTFYSDDPASPVVVDYPAMQGGTSYVLCTVAIDEYNTLCGVSTSQFQTVREVSGNPEVDVAVSDITGESFKVTLTPNDECSKYRYIVYARGEVQGMFEMYAPSMGFANMEEMIVNILAFDDFTDAQTYVKDQCRPGTDYEIFVVPYDVQGRMCDLQVTTVTTRGGDIGVSTVQIELGDYREVQTPNPDNILEIIWRPYQFFYFIPDANTARYRAEAFTEAEYLAMGEEAAAQLVCREAPADTPDDMWYRYEPKNMRWQFDPDTTGYVLACGKNANGQWGEVTILRFTTPSEAQPGSMYIQRRQPLNLNP